MDIWLPYLSPGSQGNYVSQPKQPWCKNVAAKIMLKKMQDQNRQPRPPVVDGIKILDNDDQT